MYKKIIVIGLWLVVSIAFAQQANRVELGNSKNGAKISFVRTSGGEWGIEITGSTPRLTQEKPVQIEVLQADENILKLVSVYKSVRKSGASIDAIESI